MSKHLIKVFISIVIASVFSLTAKIIITNFCQNIKFQKDRCLLYQSIPEEEKADNEENDELIDDIDLFNTSESFCFIPQSSILLLLKHVAFNYAANFEKMPAPPPKN